MKNWYNVVATPTADTPGTLMYLHFDDRRYLIGNLSEGSSRACTESSTSLRKVSDIFITGQARWSNVGGLLGTIIGLADMKKAAQESLAENQKAKAAHGSSRVKQSLDEEVHHQLNIFGPPNLNHILATSRRFIFRTGIPFSATEYNAQPNLASDSQDIDPTFTDKRLMMWAMPIIPKTIETGTQPSYSPSRKRPYEEISVSDGEVSEIDSARVQHEQAIRQSIVHQMFNSTWKYDRLVTKKLSQVEKTAVCYVREETTHQLVTYEGPMPGENPSVPDIDVLVREPWPAVNTEHLPQTRKALESVCYIIRNHTQRGRFLPDKARALDVPVGELWRRLSNGESVKNTKGETVTPEMVLQPSTPGNGCAIVDLPTVDYIDSLIDRPEWRASNVMEGVGAIVWILGPEVGADTRVREFQQRMSHMKHIVSSTDYTENTIALDGAATEALRHNYIDNEIYPKLNASSTNVNGEAKKTEKLTNDLPLSQTIQRGQMISLQPTVEIDNQNVKPPFDASAVQAKIKEEFASFNDMTDSLDVTCTPAEQMAWAERQHHGDVEFIILGTGSSHPGKYRNVSGTLVRIPGWGCLLLDAGEGTMNTLRRMFPQNELNDLLTELRLIWVSHLHADHHLGLTSVIKAWNEVRDTERQNASKLAIISDEPMLRWLYEYSSVEDLYLENVLPIATRPTPYRRTLPSTASTEDDQATALEIIQPHGSKVADNPNTSALLRLLDLTTLNSAFVSHCRGAQAVSITFPSGFKLSYSGDCRPSTHFASIGRNSDVLVHEATFEDDMRLEAMAKKHSTAGEALMVAHEMRAKVCILTHFSQRYPTMVPLGVNVSGDHQANGSAAATEVLENDNPEDQVDATVDDTAQGTDGPTLHYASSGSAAETSNSNQTSARNTALLTRKGLPVRRAEAIRQDEVQRLLDESGMKVVFAFDYMRLRLKDVPRLEKKQPIMRAMYDRGIGKEALAVEENDDDSSIRSKEETNKQKKKMEKAARLAVEREQARQRKQAKPE